MFIYFKHKYFFEYIIVNHKQKYRGKTKINNINYCRKHLEESIYVHLQEKPIFDK